MDLSELKTSAIKLFQNNGSYVPVFGSVIGITFGKGSCKKLSDDGFIKTDNPDTKGNHQYYLTEAAIEFAASIKAQLNEAEQTGNDAESIPSESSAIDTRPKKLVSLHSRKGNKLTSLHSNKSAVKAKNSSAKEPSSELLLEMMRIISDLSDELSVLRDRVNEIDARVPKV